MRTYYIEYLNDNDRDREAIIEANNPQEARHKFDMEFGMSEIRDFIDITDEDDRRSVLMEIYG